MPYKPFVIGERIEAMCPVCCHGFNKSRKNKVYCSPKCKKSHSQRIIRKKHKNNSKESRAKRRENEVLFDTAFRLAEMLYTTPPNERLGFMNNLIEKAREGTSLLRSLLINITFVYPDRENKKLFRHGCPQEYKTISEAANAYCLNSPWQSDVISVIKGMVPEPSTGEIA